MFLLSALSAESKKKQSLCVPCVSAVIILFYLQMIQTIHFFDKQGFGF